MKLFRNLGIILLIAMLSLALFACGGGECKNHADANGDGLCEECGKAVENADVASDLTLIDEGEVLFSIVYSSDVSVEVRLAINKLVKAFDDAGLELTAKEESEAEEA